MILICGDCKSQFILEAAAAGQFELRTCCLTNVLKFEELCKVTVMNQIIKKNTQALGDDLKKLVDAAVVSNDQDLRKLAMQFRPTFTIQGE